MRARIVRWTLVLLALVLIGGTVLAFGLIRTLRFDAPDDFVRRKGQLEAVRIEPAAQTARYSEHSLVLTSTGDYRLRGHLRVPREPGPWPALIVLGGVNTGRMAARLIDVDEPRVILGLDYPWEGETRITPFEFLVQLAAIRDAMLLTPSATLLALDYLESRDDVLGGSTTLIGASFGAPLATVTAALDPRVSALVLVYGGGDFEGLIAANLADVPGPARRLAARVGGWLTDPIEPTRYVDRIAPRPLVLINGRGDTRIPRSSVDALYLAAGDPKRLVWLDTGHISSRNEDLLGRVLAAAVAALEDIEAELVDAGDPPGSGAASP